MNLACLQWELDWVMEHADQYGCPQHAKAVCGNITKRYHAAEAKKLVTEYQRDPSDETLAAVYEYFELT